MPGMQDSEPDCANALTNAASTDGPAATATHIPSDPETTQAYARAGINPTSSQSDLPRMPKKIGDYQIESILGRGGMGVVYRARHSKLDRDVALKMVLSGSHASDEQLLRFIQEAKAVAHLQHPNIVQIFEVGDTDGLPYFSLEFVDGDSLDKQVRDKPLDPKRAANLTATISRAMQYAHDHHVVHRDLKPANVLMSKNGTPKVTDFGLAKRLEETGDSTSTRTGTIMGTPSYMSPEQARGDARNIGPATDQYSLGAMLYEFMTGRPPFMTPKAVDTIMQVLKEEPVSPRQLQPKVPIDLETICLKAMSKDVSKRYLNCEELARDLERFVRGEPISARPVSQWERGWRWCKRNPAVAGLSALAAIALLGVALISSVSAWLVGQKNSDLAAVNTALGTANTDLKSAYSTLETKNIELADSFKEQERRAERLQSFVQDIYTELGKINTVENPRIRDFKNETLKKTLPLMDEIVAELPEGGQAVATKMSALQQLANSYRDIGLGREAERTISELVTLARTRVEHHQGSDSSLNNLCVILKDLGRIRQDLNRDMAASILAFQEARDIAEGMVRESKASPHDGRGQLPKFQSLALLSDMESEVGLAHYRQGNATKALPHLERTRELREQILAMVQDGTAFENLPEGSAFNDRDKANIIRVLELQLRLGRLAKGVALHRVGRSEEAEPLILAVIEDSEKQLQSDPANPVVLRILAGNLGLWGDYLIHADRTDEARKVFERGAELADNMLESNANSSELQRAAATAYYRYAQSIADVEPERSVERGNQSLAIRKTMVDAEPTDTRRKIDLLLVQGRFGEIASVEEVADAYLASTSQDSEMLLQVAQGLAQAMKRSEGDDAARLKSKALKTIEAMITHGHRDIVTLECDLDLAPLQEDEDFKGALLRLQALDK